MTAPDPATVRALIAVARLAHAEVERAGLLADDAPEQVLAAVARWCESPGEATEAEVREAACELTGSQSGHDPAKRARALLQGCARDVADSLSVGTALWREVLGSSARERAAACLAVLGEPEEAARARVTAVYEAALREAGGRRPPW